jgi:Fic family protein
MASNARSKWPKVGSTRIAWERDYEQSYSRKQALLHRGFFYAAVVPKIADVTFEISAQVRSHAEDAAVELARFDAEVGQMVAPFAAMLLRSEAASSSQIENLTAAPASILKAEYGLGETPNSALIVSNQKAMSAAIAVSGEMSVASVLTMHKTLMAQADPRHAGILRTEQVWIGGSNLSPHGAKYVAPEHQAVPELVADLVKFAQRLDLSGIVQASLVHAQFETIHPFTDGNGRTGRALVHAMLHRLGVTKSVTVPVSAGLLKDTSRYFEALDLYRDGDVEPIINVFADAAFEAVENGRQLAREIQEARMRWQTMIPMRARAGATRVMENLLEQPIVSRSSASELLGTTPANAQLAIDRLVDAGILSQLGAGKRNRIWQATDVVNALERFAERSRRA